MNRSKILHRSFRSDVERNEYREHDSQGVANCDEVKKEMKA